MKKSLIFVGMLVIGYANAQEGNVGINTDQPKATLDIQPNAENAKASATTNQGIIAPRLSKERIANIASPVEGTLVYATDNVYTGTDTKVAKITEKGYYFYNGTEWVKAGANEKTQYWAEATNPNGTKNYYFVPFSDSGNEHIFNKEGYEAFEFKYTTTDRLSGKVGDLLVFSQRNGKTIVSKVPQKSNKVTEKQVQQRQKFQEAVIYSKGVLKDPTSKLEYEAEAKDRGIQTNSVAIADFLNAPKIEEVNLSAYTGKVGDTIKIKAFDDFKVKEVRVKIQNADGSLVEEGNATEQWLVIY